MSQANFIASAVVTTYLDSQRNGKLARFQFVASRNQHGRVAFLQGARLTLKSLKPDGIPHRAKNPQTLGDHLLAKRLSLGLNQKSVAHMMGVSEETYLHWEKDQFPPRVSMYPAIYAFLGGNPLAPPKTLAERLRRFRQVRGLSLEEAARLVPCDEATWAGWECGKRVHKSQLLVVKRLTVQIDREIGYLTP